MENVPYKGIRVTLLSLDNIKQMIYMRLAVETMVLRDFLEAQTPMVMEDIRHAIAQQRAVIHEPDFEAETFYRMDAQMHSIWFGAVRRQKLWRAPGPAAALHPIPHAGLHHRDRLYADHRGA